MNTAQTIAQRLTDGHWGAFSLAMGYATRGASQAGAYRFEPCRVLSEKRNQRGRVTLLRGQYSDGSAIEYRYSDARETYTVRAV